MKHKVPVPEHAPIREAAGGVSRRAAIRMAVPILAAPAALHLFGAPAARRLAGAVAGADARYPQRSPLPPRTVGLRSLGGAFRFDPPGLLIDAGEVVTWLNMGDFHTVTSFHPDNDHLLGAPIHLRMPEGAEPFHSGMLGLNAGSVFEHKFTIEGVYDYFCQPHYSFGMVGRIVVGGPRGGPAVSGDDSDLIEAARRQLPGVAAIVGVPGRAWEWASRINGVLLQRTRQADAGAAARAVARGAGEDGELRARLGMDGTRSLEGTLGAFVDAVAATADYETLVRLADDAKQVLTTAP